MKPKPLTQERRADIESSLQSRFVTVDIRDMFNDLFAAEAYWREAVKNADVTMAPCPFCKSMRIDSWGEREHEPECAWKLSQSE